MMKDAWFDGQRQLEERFAAFAEGYHLSFSKDLHGSRLGGEETSRFYGLQACHRRLQRHGEDGELCEVFER